VSTILHSHSSTGSSEVSFWTVAVTEAETLQVTFASAIVQDGKLAAVGAVQCEGAVCHVAAHGSIAVFNLPPGVVAAHLRFVELRSVGLVARCLVFARAPSAQPTARVAHIAVIEVHAPFGEVVVSAVVNHVGGVGGVEVHTSLGEVVVSAVVNHVGGITEMAGP